MRPRLFLAMGSAIVLLLIIHSANGGGCGGAVQGQGLGRGRDRVPSQRLSRRAGGRRKITGGDIEPAITSNPANLRNIIMTRQQDSGFGARTDFIRSSLHGGKTWAHSTIRLTVCLGSNGGLRVRPVDLGWR